MARRTRLWGLAIPGRPDGAHARTPIPPVAGGVIVIHSYVAEFFTAQDDPAEMGTELMAVAELV